MAERITLDMVERAVWGVGGGIRGMLVEKAILDSAFRVVADPKDWRAPIDGVVNPDACEYDVDVIVRAVAFFTSTEATVEPSPESPGAYRVRASGYRRGPAGP